MEDLATSRYQQRGLLGQGAMGRVYLVHDPLLRRDVALKEVLNPAVGLAELKQEFWWMTRLRHPHLVEVFDFGLNEQGRPFFTMEVVAGQALDQRLPLPPDAARDVLKQLLGALGHIHLAGLVHGDIKPENMRLMDDGTLKLMDFGLMAQAGQAVSVRGTPAYMAPEVIRGGRVDRRADLYALGVLAYQLLTGRLPFEAATQGALLEAHLTAQAPAPSASCDGLEANWDQVIARLLEKEPVRRFQSAREVLEALGESTDGEDDGALMSPPFVGREAELARFDDGLSALASERRSVALVVGGEAGMGKSRLLDEFAFRAQLGHCLVLRGAAGAASGAPYEAIKQVLQQAWPLLQLEDGQRGRLAASLRSLMPELATETLDDDQRMEPQQEKQRLQGAIADVLRQLARQQGLVLLLDGWQDADPLSAEVLGVLKRQLAAEPVLVACATRRPDGDDAMVLAPLAGAELARMLGAMLGEEHVPESFWAPIAEISGGVPEVAEALLRHLVEHRGLPREGGRWRLAALSPADLPGGAHEILASRLAELTPIGRRILELAGVIQGDFTMPLLTRLLPDVAAETLDDELAWLVQRQLVRQAKEQFRLAQPAMGVVLCQGLGEERLQGLHTQVAEALEELLTPDATGDAGADGLVLRVAHHFLAGVRQAKAVLYALKAAQYAETLLANDLTMDFAQRGWAWLESPDMPAEGLAHLRPAYLCLMGDLHRRKGDFAEAARCYDEAMPLARSHGRADLEAHMLVGSGVLKQMQKDGAGALAVYEQALPVCQTLANPREELRCLTTMGRTYYQAGDATRAEDLFQRALTRTREVGNKVFEAESLAFLGLIWASGKTAEGRPSRVTEGLEMFQQSIAVKQSIGDKLGLNDTYMLLGNAQLKLGDMIGAADSFARNWALCEETGALDDGVFAHLNLTIVGVERGDPATALASSAQALSLAAAIKADFSWGLAKSLESWALAHLGRLGEAQASHQAALAHAHQLKNTYLELFALVYGVESALVFGEGKAARAALDAALQKQADSGETEYATPLTLAGARVAVLQGMVDEARSAFEALLAEAEEKSWRLLAAQATFGLAQCERRRPEAIALARAAAQQAEAAGANGLLAECRLLLSFALEADGQAEAAQAEARSALALAEAWNLPDLIVRGGHRCAVLLSPSAQSNRLLKQAQAALADQLEGLADEDRAVFLSAGGRTAVQQGELSAGVAGATNELSSLKHRVGEAQAVVEVLTHQRDLARRLQRGDSAPDAMDATLSLVLALTGAGRAEIVVKEGRQLVSALRRDAAGHAPITEEWRDYIGEVERVMATQQALRGLAPAPKADRAYWVLPLSAHAEDDGAILVLGRAGMLDGLGPDVAEAIDFATETLAHALRALRAKSEGKRITERFQMLNELGRAVGSSLELEQVLRVLLEQTLTLTHANLAYVILPDGDKLACRYGLNAEGERVTGLEISYTLANRVLNSREPLCILDTGAEEDTQTASVLALNLQSVMCVPLIVKDELVGLLYVSSNYVSRTFTQQDLDLLIAIAGQTALSVQNALYLAEMEEKKRMEAELGRIGQEMEIATRIQTALLPTDLAIEGFDLAMELRTATEVGGDLIDYIPQADGRFWLAVGDVTGHGLTPGLIMMMTQSIFSALAMTSAELTPRDLLIRLNQALYQNVRNRLNNDNFLTLQLVRHEGDGHFSVAGLHCDLLVYRAAAQRVERLESPGFWTGFVPDVEDMTEQHSFQLAPEDVLLLYTDGLIEAKNTARVQYDMARLEAALLQYGPLPVDAIKAKILDEVMSWLVTVDDDISIVVLKRQAGT